MSFLNWIMAAPLIRRALGGKVTDFACDGFCTDGAGFTPKLDQGFWNQTTERNLPGVLNVVYIHPNERWQRNLLSLTSGRDRGPVHLTRLWLKLASPKISARKYVRKRFVGARDVVELRSERASLILV